MEATKGLSEIKVELQTDQDDDRPIFIAGAFNQWATAHPDYQMERQGPGQYRYTFRLPAESHFPIEYKYVRGDWSDVELDQSGAQTPNRLLYPGQESVMDKVPRWARGGHHHKTEFLPKIEVISESFVIPQLIKTRRVAALLPHNYHQTDRRYPVLYLQDGQNLFDEHAPFGNWGVDKRLAEMAERGTGDIIVISIDHAEKERISEFTPSQQTRLGVGDGKKYAQFLTETLKPYVDKHFRTLPDRAHTGIGGSSMGGLISIYAGLLYPEVYGNLMIFSPSLWVIPQMQFQTMNFNNIRGSKIYLYAGEGESKTMIPLVKRFKEALEKHLQHPADVVFHLTFDPNGIHNEARWGQEFTPAVEWLFFQE